MKKCNHQGVSHVPSYFPFSIPETPKIETQFSVKSHPLPIPTRNTIINPQTVIFKHAQPHSRVDKHRPSVSKDRDTH